MQQQPNILMRIARWLERIGFRRDWYLIPLAGLIGAIAGIVALGFGRLVEFAERFFLSHVAGGQLSGSHWWLVLALPATGGLLVGLIKYVFRRPVIGHGVPEVMEAVARRRGDIPARVGVFSTINPALSIGSGGSAGEEGPIIAIGASVGSVVGRALRVNRQDLSTLVGCGAAGGLAAIFGAPIAGVLLVMEVILRDFSLKTFMPIVIASVMASAVFQAAAGQSAALFTVPPELMAYHFPLYEIIPYLFLGICCGVVGYAFTRSMYGVERLMSKLPVHPVTRPMFGGLALGVLGLGFVAVYGHVFNTYEPPPFFGNGYPVIEHMMNPATYQGVSGITAVEISIAMVALAGLFKMIGTSLTLGSGGAGGVFAPALFIGAMTGAAFGMSLKATGIYADTQPALYALVGMAGALAATVHCPLTAIILVFETTRDYTVILPVMLVAIAATVISQVLMGDSIYTRALREMGVRVGTMSDLTVLRRLSVAQVPLAPAVFTFPGDPALRLLELAEAASSPDFVVTNVDGGYVGVVTGEDVRTALLEREALPLMVVAELLRSDLPTLGADDTLDLVLDQFAIHDVASLPVVDENGRVTGMITRGRLMRTYRQALDER